jgi:pyrroline-5-carboxylate reductase
MPALLRLGFIGGGNMAEAIVRGVLSAGVSDAGGIAIAEKSEARREFLAREFPGTRITADIPAAASEADVVILAVKPQNIPEVLPQLVTSHQPLATNPSPVTSHQSLVTVLSICAGIRTAALEAGLPAGARVVRVMPNTPALIGLGWSGICPGANAGADDIAMARRIFDAVGESAEVSEDLMDAVTALTGSGPAYVFYLMESLIESGVRMGFTPEQAAAMVRQLLLGAATLAANSDKSPAQLRAAVTSPGGTTAAGVAALDRERFRDTIVDCVLAAERRGKELGLA